VSTPRPVRVLHIIDGLAGGGSERWIWDLARLIDSSRVQQRVVTVHPDFGRFVYGERLREMGVYGHAHRQPARDRAARVVGVRVSKSSQQLAGSVHRVLRGAWHWGAVFPLASARIAAEIFHRPPDVIHSHTFHAFVAAVLSSAAIRTPHVHTVPALAAQMQQAGFGWMPACYRRFNGAVCRFFTAYPSELARMGVSRSAAVEIPGVIDNAEVDRVLGDAAIHRAELRRRLGASSCAPIALSVGRLHPSKGHSFALEALPTVLSREPDLHWVVAGDGSDREALQKRAVDLGVAERVHLLGFVDNPAHLYAGSDLYLRTNVFEADNLSSYQAMAAGLPVVGFATGAETELIDKVGHGILVTPGSSAELADGIAALLSTPDRGRRLGAIGAAYSRQHLDIRVTVELMTSTYEDLARRVAQSDAAPTHMSFNGRL
jgi:glycosyltransferase involved in cell wall biosynthesis